MNMNILGIGESVIDKISIVENQLSSSASEMQYDAGGPVLSALVLLSRLGATCTFITSLGQDQEGQLIRDILIKENIELIETMQDITKQHTILVDAKTGQRKKIRGAVKHKPITGLNPGYVQAFDTVIMDRHEHSAFYEVVRHRKSGNGIIADPSTEVSAFTRDMMRHVPCPIIPIESLVELGEGGPLDKALHMSYLLCGKPFIVTLGELGSLIYDGDTIELIPPARVAVVDANGAGDIYRGAFAFGQLQSWGLRQSAVYANALAALQCTRPGNVSAIPTKPEIDAELKNIQYQDMSMDMVRDLFQTLFSKDFVAV
jgi:sulfofructose kinase